MGDPSDDRDDFCAFVLPGLHPQHFLSHIQEQLHFDHSLFFSFRLFPSSSSFTPSQEGLFGFGGAAWLSVGGKLVEEWL